jgi:hypothetical protein
MNPWPVAARMRSAALFGVGLIATLAYSRPAFAIDFDDVGGEPLTLDVTNTATLAYAFDNRDDVASAQPPPSTIVNDTYGESLDRLNVQAYWWRLRLGVRIDAATYFAQLDDADLAEIARERLPDGSGPERNDYINAFKRELNTRYRNTYYPSKLSLGYTAPGIDLTLGDFYAQFGRGFVLSVRKIDELATDTTIRGAKASFKESGEAGSLSVTALAGQMNPIRIDEQSGRRLNGDGSPLFFGFPQANDFEYFYFDEAGNSEWLTTRARPSYLEDSMFGASVEGGPRFFSIGAHGSVLRRKSYAEDYLRCIDRNGEDCGSQHPTFSTNNISRLRDTIVTASGSLNVPNIADHGDAYVEVAMQHLTDGRPTGIEDGGFSRERDLTGYAVYGSATVRGGPLAVNFEGKHYRSFFPLSANVNSNGAADSTYAAPEFDAVNYNQVPVVEPIYTQPIGQPNICITGGRVKADYEGAPEKRIYGWVGRYTSLSEVNALNADCVDDNPEDRTNTWDTGAGTDMSFERGRSYVKAWIGLRNTEHAVPVTGVNLGGPSNAFYREGYLRYDMAKHLGGDFTLQAQGFHRYRYEPLFSRDSWAEGENYTALRWAPHYAFIMGVEYLGRLGCTPDAGVEECFYFSGGFQFKSGARDTVLEQLFDTVNLFVGQRRGAIRCVSGVCRQFPPFEGARLELTSRF